MQGLNITAVHAHAALFGVYGNLGLTLLSLRLLTVRTQWRTRSLWFAFWSINIGLALMALLSLLPVGLAQTWASFEHGMWYARSAEFLQTPVLEGVPLAPLHRGHDLRGGDPCLRVVRDRFVGRLVGRTGSPGHGYREGG